MSDALATVGQHSCERERQVQGVLLLGFEPLKLTRRHDDGYWLAVVGDHLALMQPQAEHMVRGVSRKILEIHVGSNQFGTPNHNLSF